MVFGVKVFYFWLKQCCFVLILRKGTISYGLCVFLVVLSGRLSDPSFSHDPSGGIIAVQQTEKLYPVQITLPAQQGSGETSSRVLTIQVPESGITGMSLANLGREKHWLGCFGRKTLLCLKQKIKDYKTLLSDK